MYEILLTHSLVPLAAVDFAFVREYLVKDFPRESTAEHKRQV